LVLKSDQFNVSEIDAFGVRKTSSSSHKTAENEP